MDFKNNKSALLIDKPYLTIGESCLREDATLLAPILAWLITKSNILENLYVFCDPKNELGALLHFLFYRAKGVEFEPTKLANNIHVI